mgnify:CR=1 FL=1
MNKFLKSIGLIFLTFMTGETLAQSEEMIRVNVYQDTVRIYHNKIQPVGHGFNIYRDGEKLNQQPVTGVNYPEELQAAMGEQYSVLSGMMNTETVQETFIKLRANRYVGRLAAFLFPAVAQSLGQVITDKEAPLGQQVTYRIEFVNDLGQPTGEILEKKVQLVPLTILPPKNLQASNEGNLVTLGWEYPGSSREEDDQVIQFRAYRKNAATGESELLNQEIILRNSAENEFTTSFDALNTGTQEQYFVTAVDISGNESAPSQILNYKIIDNQPPQQVSGVNAFSQGTTITISWNANTDSDLAGYRVFRSRRMNQGFEQITTELLEPLQTYFKDDDLEPGKNYSYKIAAVDKSGNVGQQSLAAMARIRDNQPPDAVKNLTVIYNGEQVELSWNPVSQQENFRSYVLLRKRLGAGNTSFARLNPDDLSKTSFLDEGAAGKGFLEGAKYEYAVLAMDSANNFSDTTRMLLQIPDLTPPAPPTQLTARNRDGIRVELNWDASSSADAVKYKIYRSGLTSEPDLISELDKKTRITRDERVKPGQSYIYRVSAVDSLGNESEPSLADTVEVKDSAPPHQVRNVRLATHDEGLRISWEPVNAFDLAGYRIYQAEIATGKYELVKETAANTTQQVMDPVKVGAWYRVRAVDTSGNESKPSEPKQIKELP